MREYCLAYKCESDTGKDKEDVHAWEVVAQACVCFKTELWDIAQTQLTHYDSLFPSVEPVQNASPLASLKRYT